MLQERHSAFKIEMVSQRGCLTVCRGRRKRLGSTVELLLSLLSPLGKEYPISENSYILGEERTPSILLTINKTAIFCFELTTLKKQLDHI